jgi:transposase-like protein
MSSSLVATASRYLARQQRTFFTALRELRELSQRPHINPNLFENEDDATCYLADWQQTQRWQCAECDRTVRYLFPSQNRFECRCGRQHSIRHSTVFSRSRVPLIAWLQLAVLLIVDAEQPVSELAKAVHVVRLATLRRMRNTVREALNAPDAIPTPGRTAAICGDQPASGVPLPQKPS